MIHAIHDTTAEIARNAQGPAAYEAWVLAANPYIGGNKNIQIEDFYTGLARVGLDDPPYGPAVMRGIDLAVDLEGELGRLVLAQKHMDLLEAKKLMRYWGRRKKKRR